MEFPSTFANQFNSPAVQFLISNKWVYRIIKHGLMNLLLLFVFFYAYLDENFKDDHQSAVLRFLFNFILYLISAALVYFNIYYLVPRLLFTGRFGLYIIVTASCALLYTLVVFYGLPIIPILLTNQAIPSTSIKWYDILDTLILPSIFLASTTGILVQKKWILDTIRYNELEKQQLNDELKQLKSQVNPHFLFNTLNNLHTLTRIDPEKASQVLLSLSDILRYQLYESNKEKILLSKDIENIRKILELEQVRRDQFEYQITITGNLDGRLAPPFLFTPFVENAIKHSHAADKKTVIALHFSIEQDKLSFDCTNTKPLIPEHNAVGGLGLANIQRRLELLFSKQYVLKIDETPEAYFVHLILPL